jgi:hypothetical protein
MQFQKRLSVVSIALCFAASAPAFAAKSSDHFLVGNFADVVTPTSGLLVLQGGGTAYEWGRERGVATSS